MSVHVVRVPDVGEGVVQAELVEWLVEVGDVVTTESAVVELLTDKATVEISSPVAGTVAYCNGAPGDLLAVGSDLLGITVDAELGPEARQIQRDPGPSSVVVPAVVPVVAAPLVPGDRPRAAPAVRRRAMERGIDLHDVRGSGPGGRILDADLEIRIVIDLDHLDADLDAPAPAVRARTGVTVTEIRGVRRAIAARMTESWQTPHITYVEEVDLTEVERLRAALTERVTLLPFVVRAIVRACADHPLMSSTFHAGSGTLTTHDAVHVGIATQTDTGLLVPVVRHAEAMSLSALAAEIVRVTTAAREGRATRDELGGSTITVTSLGKQGGLATTPILNHPEVAIVGVNKLQVRPLWDGTSFAPRSMVNLSSSFDHRVVDGWDAAVFVQRVKELLELPALLFMAEALA